MPRWERTAANRWKGMAPPGKRGAPERVELHRPRTAPRPGKGRLLRRGRVRRQGAMRGARPTPSVRNSTSPCRPPRTGSDERWYSLLAIGGTDWSQPWPCRPRWRDTPRPGPPTGWPRAIACRARRRTAPWQTFDAPSRSGVDPRTIVVAPLLSHKSQPNCGRFPAGGSPRHPQKRAMNSRIHLSCKYMLMWRRLPRSSSRALEDAPQVPVPGRLLAGLARLIQLPLRQPVPKRWLPVGCTA